MQERHCLERLPNSAPDVIKSLLPNATHDVQGRVVVDVDGFHQWLQCLLEQRLVVLAHHLAGAKGGVVSKIRVEQAIRTSKCIRYA